jgi:hypothetical protein
MTNRFRNKASALVTTLFVLVVLSTIVVAFLASMNLERKIAQSTKNKYQAELAAEAGVEDFVLKITRLMTERPLHAIGYTNQGGSNGVSHPVLLGSKAYSGETPQIFLLNSSNQTLNSLPAFTDANSVNINITNSVAGARGWIGSPVRKIEGLWSQTTPTNRALWVNILANPSLPNQPNPAIENYNPIISRYAYWAEDETAKININIAGNNDGLDGAFVRNATVSTNADQLDVGAVIMGLQANPAQPLPMANTSAPANSAVVEFMDDKKDLPKTFRLLAFNDAVALQGLDEEDNKFHATYDSLSNELAGTGRRRANLNHIVSNSMDPDVIAADLDDIIYVITGEHIFNGSEYHGELLNAAHEGVFLEEDEQDDDTRAMPEFGRRFYTSPEIATGVSLKDDHKKTYLLKLAANIRDYIDTDSQPTFVDFDGEVKAGAPITEPWLSGEEPVVLGKEAIPCFQEHVWYAQLNNITIIPGTNPSNRRSVDFTFDHYFEFYNPSNKDWTAPAGTVLYVRNLFPFDGNQFPPIELPDFEIDLSNRTFPAGSAVVITTAPEDPVGLVQNGAVIIRGEVPATSREFNGKIGNRQVGGGTGDNRRFGISVIGRTSAATDYETEMVFTTPVGVIDAFPFITLAGSGSPFEMTRSVSGLFGTWALPEDQRKKRFIWAHSLRGNDNVSRTGDPRSLSEPLQLVAGSGVAYGNGQARFFNNFDGDSHKSQVLPGNYVTSGNPRITLGSPANPEYVRPINWPDYHPLLSNSAGNAYAVISDSFLKSIGELGHIYDPHRKMAPGIDGEDATPTEATRIKRARGGGRTLKVGQPDDLVANTRFAAATTANISWFNGAWRLTDLFSADSADKPESDSSADGKININGVMRDGGTAFRAALRGFIFQTAPDGDPLRQGKTLSESEMDQLISQIITYLHANGPMLCRGELGQIPFFSAAGVAGTAGEQASSTAMDRSREEIFRRIVELITTRSLSYKIYVIGQAVRQNPDGSVVPIATSYQQARVKLEPEIEEQVNARVSGYKGQIEAKLSL